MSRFDAEYDRTFAEQQARDARDFVVGTTVYRAKYDHVEEGTVRTVSRCNLHGEEAIEDPNGEYPYYVAQFGGWNAFNGDWVEQTYSWKWFASKAQATRELAREMSNRIAEKEREIKKLHEQIVALGVVDDEERK